ncbi:MAG: slipin family protein [Betaproteobacteria bacterium]|nr:MAG: slipin family protein [Betaproteobacteria bacterium]
MILDFVNMGLGSVLLLLMLLIFSALRILREYERGVVFQLGRFWKVKGPGLVLVIPGIQQMVRVDLRVVTLDVPPQDVISRDNVSVKVNAVVFFRVVDPQRAIIQVENFLMATSQLAQTTLRVVLGKHELDEMLAERERRAKVIHADGEKQAAAALLEAARMLSLQPEAMQLRYLQTMTQVAGDRASTLVFPLPMDLLGPLLTRVAKASEGKS